MVKLIIKNLNLDDVEILEFFDFNEFRNYFNSNIIEKPIKIQCPKETKDSYGFGSVIDKNYKIDYKTLYYIFEETVDYIITVFPDNYKAERRFTIIKVLTGERTTFNSIREFIKNKKKLINQVIKKVSGVPTDWFDWYSKKIQSRAKHTLKKKKYQLIIEYISGDEEFNTLSFSYEDKYGYYTEFAGRVCQHEPINLIFEI